MITWIHSTLYVIPLVWSRTISNCCYAVYNESMETFAQSVQSTTLSGLSPCLSSQLKSFSKDLCKKKLDWDEKITEDLSLKGLAQRITEASGVFNWSMFQTQWILRSCFSSATLQKSLMELFLTSGWSRPMVMYIVHLSLANPDYPH